jgi:hypothetical protein
VVASDQIQPKSSSNSNRNDRKIAGNLSHHRLPLIVTSAATSCSKSAGKLA